MCIRDSSLGDLAFCSVMLCTVDSFDSVKPVRDELDKGDASLIDTLRRLIC